MASQKLKLKPKLSPSKGKKLIRLLKIKSLAAKRYKLTVTGLVKVPHSGKQHWLNLRTVVKNRLKKAKIMRAESSRLVSVVFLTDSN